MSEIASPSGDATFKGKPEKPDEDAFKKNLANAEKQHKESMAKFVSDSILNSLPIRRRTAIRINFWLEYYY